VHTSLNAIKAGKSLCSPNVLNEINDLIDDINVDIKFIWVPSHLGVTGNEIADSLAQSAIINDTSVTVSFELKEIYDLVQEYIITKWQHLWQFSSTGKFYRKIEPNVSLKIKYKNSIRRKEIIITRMRFGICLTNDYLKKINTAASDLCDVCNECVETLEHILLGCARSILCCKILNACTALNVNPQLEIILKNPDII